ncbi:MAG TPA: ATP-dependent sacrificial sulfur transferase LarE [Candidatus Thermoplasmatota archaeon]|nr:ATP-dependent sacrificial sulfur transferase LarE [Candidatus Thermoplasmatota archaeon]
MSGPQPPVPKPVEETLQDLRAAFRARGSALVAFSGGVDSAVLAKIAHEELGDRALSVIVNSESYAASELEEARRTGDAMGIRYEVVFESELADPNYAMNPTNRCYFCRKNLSSALTGMARERGYSVVVVGTNLSDLGEWRPGLKALNEAGAWQPFVEHNVDKAGVRELARLLGVPVAEKPSMACLSSRIPYGEAITEGKLRRIEKAEGYVRALGFRQVRVRSLGDVARIEVLPEEIERLNGLFPQVEAALRDFGYHTVAVDPRGYRAGSMSEGLRLLNA